MTADIHRTATTLAVLWPALDDALERDQGAADGDRVTAAAVDPATPVNDDVVSTMTAVGIDITLTAAWAAHHLGDPVTHREPVDQVAHLPTLHDRMLAHGDALQADMLADAVRRWLRAVKLALGLAEPDRRLGQWCPHHDDILCELVVPGLDSDLTWRRLDRDGRPADVVVTWQRRAEVVCRVCGTVWRPGEYLALDRELRVADARRLAELDAESEAA